MLNDDDLRAVEASLADADPAERAAMLAVLRDNPTGDARLLPPIEALLADTTPCLMQVKPFVFCEVRWLAAHALAAERAARGIGVPVEIDGVVPPVAGDDIPTVEPEAYAGGRRRAGVEGHLEAFALAREWGLLPRADLRLQWSVMPEDRFDEFVRSLQSDDPAVRAAALSVFLHSPYGDARVLPPIEALLGDTTPVRFGKPSRIGEFRWLAAHALARARAAAGVDEPVRLHAVPEPVAPDALPALADDAGVGPDEAHGTGNRAAALYAALRSRNRLPLRDLELRPRA